MLRWPVKNFSLRSLGVSSMMPLAVFCVLAACTVSVWRTERLRLEESASGRSASLARLAAQSIESTLNHEAWDLRRLVNRGRNLRFQNDQHFSEVVQARLRSHEVYPFIAFADSSGIIQGIDGTEENLAPLMVLSSAPEWLDLTERARTARAMVMDRPAIGETGMSQVAFAVSLFAGSEDQTFVGTLLGRLDIGSLLGNAIEPDVQPNHSVEIWDRSTPLYRTALSARVPEPTTAIEALHVFGRTWEVRAQAPLLTSGNLREDTPFWVLIGGLVASAAIAVAAGQACRLRTRRLHADRKQMEALESLNEITAVISSQLGAQKDLLDYLARSACRLLEMDRACVLLFDSDHRQFHVMANHGFNVTAVGQCLDVTDVPLSARALNNGEIVTSENLARETRPFNRALAEKQGLHSMMFIPLHVGSERVGLLVLGSLQVRRFTDRERRLAELLGSQVAVTVTNNRLYEQMSESLRAQQRLQLQREKLTAITLAVYQASSLDESLKRLVDLAPAALEMDLCIVSMISDPGDATCIAAATAPFESLIGRRFEVAGHNAETVLRSRQMLAIEDGSADQTIHEQLRQLVRIGSMLYLPLFESNGKPLGLMFLIRHTVGAFSEEQLRLAQIFATRAAGAIESARLYQQTRRDADTKAMLLRELNHRVKNNLAGIVGLLSTRPGDLEFPPAARQWLERVIDRISIMGRAHELFVGGPQTVGLEELIDQLLPTLSIVKPAGVKIAKELHGLSVTLTTERAIALAMVLHELCCNAIAHGIGQQGTIVIRARAQDTGIVIEVADDGSREKTAQIDSRRAPMVDLKPQPFQQSVADLDEERGWGLRLVEGLVTRELRGRFSMSSRLESPRGTVARVELPINGDIEGSRNP